MYDEDCSGETMAETRKLSAFLVADRSSSVASPRLMKTGRWPDFAGLATTID
jgi:hypothetical protein